MFYHCAAPARQSRVGGGRGWADLAFPPPPTISKKTDRQIACSRLQHSAEKSDAKNARGLERVGSRSRASYFPLACQSHFRDVPTICKLTDRQTDRQTDTISTRSFFNFLFWTYKEVGLCNLFHVKLKTEVLQIILICLLFCVSDETVRYAATLCLAKTHSKDEEPKNQ